MIRNVENYINITHDKIINDMISTSKPGQNLVADIEKFINEIYKMLQINAPKHEKVVLAPETEFMITVEGNSSFNLFYELINGINNNDIEKAKKIFKDICNRAFNGDSDARVAEAMCTYCGILKKKNKTEAWEKLNYLAKTCNNLIATSLLGQYEYLVTYKEKHNKAGLPSAKGLLNYAAKEGSMMAQKFIEKYKNDLR